MLQTLTTSANLAPSNKPSLIVENKSISKLARKDGVVREADASTTIQTRIHALSVGELSDILNDNAAEYCRLERVLFASVHHSDQPVRKLKTEFCKKHNILARQFNSLAAGVSGMISSVQELQKEALKSAQLNLKNAKAAVSELDKTRKALRNNTSKFTSRAALTKFQRKYAYALARVSKLTRKVTELKGALTLNAPSVTFGSKRLFRRQFNLKANNYGSHAEWLTEWRDARSNHLFYLGSHDETAGNSNCQLTAYAPDIDAVNIKLRLLPSIAEKHKASGLVDKNGCISINRVYFPKGYADLKRAMILNEAITVRMHRDAQGWLISVTFDKPSAEVVSQPARFGAIGIDFNQDHLAISETDSCGNPIQSSIGVKLATDYNGEMTTGQRVAILSDALTSVVNYAVSVKKPIVIEDLDFARKKELMSNKPKSTRTAKRNYQLSTLSYSKYLAMLSSKCRRAGIELIKVRAAYTSVLGAIKYAKTRGLSVHGSAALVISRRGQGFIESLPRTSKVVVPVNGTTLSIALPEGRKSRNVHSTALAAIAKVYRSALFKYFKELKENSQFLDDLTITAIRQ